MVKNIVVDNSHKLKGFWSNAQNADSVNVVLSERFDFLKKIHCNLSDLWKMSKNIPLFYDKIYAYNVNF